MGVLQEPETKGCFSLGGKFSFTIETVALVELEAVLTGLLSSPQHFGMNLASFPIYLIIGSPFTLPSIFASVTPFVLPR